MPYIERQNREALAARRMAPGTPGELNFVISDLVNEYIHTTGTGYSVLNEIMGVLSCVQAELYRRLAPYEDHKRAANGDVFTAAEHFIRAGQLP